MADQCSTLADRLRAWDAIVQRAGIDLSDHADADRVEEFLRHAMERMEKRKKLSERLWGWVPGSIAAVVAAGVSYLIGFLPWRPH